MQKYFDAVESFHKALSLRRDDAFSTTMLNNVVEHLVDDITPFEAYPSEVPKLPPVPMNMSSGVSTFFSGIFRGEESNLWFFNLV